MMKIIKAWSLQTWDGCGGYNHKAYVLSEEDALAWKKANPMDYIQEKTFVFYESLPDMEEGESQELRKRALAKLSDAEKLALGLKV